MQLGKVRETIARIMELRREQEKVFRELLVWADAQDQGINLNDVAAFGWDVEFLTERQRKYYHQIIDAGNIYSACKNEPWMGQWLFNTGSPLWYNHVKLKDGTVRRLDPFIQAAEGRVLP